MIAYVKGKLITIQEDSVIVDVGGIGYEIICPDPFKYQKDVDTDILIHTFHHVREDIQCLFGFQQTDEKLLFTKLIAVSGIGPKSAISILGAIEVPDFIAAIEREDEKYLTQFPGIGKKTARQMILDLKGKINGVFAVSETTQETPTSKQQYAHFIEVEQALETLGYTRKEIGSIMPKLRNTGLDSTDELIKKALRLLTNK